MRAIRAGHAQLAADLRQHIPSEVRGIDSKGKASIRQAHHKTRSSRTFAVRHELSEIKNEEVDGDSDSEEGDDDGEHDDDGEYDDNESGDGGEEDGDDDDDDRDDNDDGSSSGSAREAQTSQVGSALAVSHSSSAAASSAAGDDARSSAGLILCPVPECRHRRFQMCKKLKAFKKHVFGHFTDVGHTAALFGPMYTEWQQRYALDSEAALVVPLLLTEPARLRPAIRRSARLGM